MTGVWGAMAIGGLALIVWAMRSLPPGTDLRPGPIVEPTRRGPYRWLAHPMYVGNVIHLAGLGGLGGGFWNALAIGCVAETVMREWTKRETMPGGRERDQ